MAAAPLLVGIDAGTSRVRVLICTPEGRCVATGSTPTPTTQPRPGWAEHDAEGLWQATASACRAAIGQLDQPARIAGVAIASFGEALVTLDRAGQPTGPVIAWYDERPMAEVEALTARLGKDRLYGLTGLSADPTFTLGKLLWLQAHQPEALAASTLWLNLTHYLAWRLCGVPGCDYTQASRSLAFDLSGRTWLTALIEEVGLAPAHFAELRPLGARLGTVLPEASQATGLPVGTPIGVGGHDHLVGAFAVGALEPGVVLDSMGTAEAITMPLPGPHLAPELGRRGYSQGLAAIGDRFTNYIFGGFPASGASVEWFRSLFAETLPHAELIARASACPPGCHGVGFLPDLRGRISPVPDALARGAWFGLAADSTAAMLYRAILEGLAFEARQTLDTLIELPDLPPIRRITAIGGNTQNPLLMQIKASVYGRPILAAEMAEATALGAALLGGLAAGLWPDASAARAGLQLGFRQIDPVPGWGEHYAAQYRTVYQPAYAALRPLHHAAAALAG